MLETPIDQSSPAPSGKEKSPYQADRLRGVKEARTAIEALKAKWPAIFNDPKNIKPLASSVLSQVAAALGWSFGYTRGVFHVWKSHTTIAAPFFATPSASISTVRQARKSSTTAPKKWQKLNSTRTPRAMPRNAPVNWPR